MLLISVWFAWKPENLQKGEAAVGCLQLKRKQRREVERGRGGGVNGWHAVRAVSEQPTGEGVSKSVCPHYPKWLKPWLGLAEFLLYLFRYTRRVFFEPNGQVEYSSFAPDPYISLIMKIQIKSSSTALWVTQEIHIKELPADSERYFAKSDSEEIVRQLQVGCMIHLFLLDFKGSLQN